MQLLGIMGLKTYFLKKTLNFESQNPKVLPISFLEK
jgi:hypothetical protein